MDVCRAGVAWKEVMSASTPLPETVASEVDFPADDLALEPSGETNAASSSQPDHVYRITPDALAGFRSCSFQLDRFAARAAGTVPV